VKDGVAAVGEAVFTSLVERGTLRLLSDDVVFLQTTYKEMTARIVKTLRMKDALTVAETRDLFGSSRKYILALLEYLDARGVTKREGDIRRLT
jgi:selenocysteine-specific elongation factor